MHRDDRLFAIIGGAVVTAVACIFLIYAAGITGGIEDRPVVRSLPTPSVEIEPQPPEKDSAPDLPKAAESSGVVRASFDPATRVHGEVLATMVAGISAHPQWASWLVTDDLLLRFVNAVEAVADGYSPTDELDFVDARGPFLVREHDEGLVIAAGTFRRYNLAVEVLSSIDADRAELIFRELEPEIEQIRAGVAWHRGDFEDRLRQAVDHLLAVEVPTGPIEVERRRTHYAFAADEYQRLSGAQQHLLRMGATNAQSFQEKLRELRLAFEWPEPETAPIVQEAVAPMPESSLETEPIIVAESSVTAVEPVEPMVTPHDPRAVGFPVPYEPFFAPPVPPSSP